MANNIAGINRRVQPNVFTRVRTRQRVNAASGGTRVACIIGEGETEETLIISALGGGEDGVNADFSGSDDPDGRHFQFSAANLVSGRVSVLKNGLPLSVLEDSISVDPFDARYGCRVDITNGRLELQPSHLVDFGGSGSTSQYYKAGVNNWGNGIVNITTASLLDLSAPSEVWTARVVSVVKDGDGETIPGKAIISVSGTVSGVLKDVNGNAVRWKSDGVAVSNDVLDISFSEGVVPFKVGDKFTIEVSSGVLVKGDELTVSYIPEANLNDAELFTSPQALFEKHGQPSSENTLSLGAAMAFENGASSVYAIQAKPSVPKKTCATLLAADNPLTTTVTGATGDANLTDTIFPLPFGALPDADSRVVVYVTSPNGTEEQVTLSKVDFYNTSWTTTAAAYSDFVTGSYSESYTMISAPQVEQSGDDGYFLVTGVSTANFNSPTISFSADRLVSAESDLSKKILKFVAGSLVATYSIDSVGDGYGNLAKATLTLDSGTNATGTASWQMVDPADLGIYFALTDDVVLNYMTEGKGLRVCYVDQKDATFFDTNWLEAYGAAELIDCNFIVPLPKATISNVFAAGKAHVEEQSNILNKHERMLLIGAITGLDPDDLVGRTLAAVEDIGILEGIQGDDASEVLGGEIEDLANYDVTVAFGDVYRTIYMTPDEIIRNVNGTNISLHGFYQAAALAGFLSAQTNVAEPPTYKTLVGYTIPRSKTYKNAVLDELADAGVLVTQPVAGGARMLHGLTTTQSGAPEEEEISIIGVRDQVARTLRAVLLPFVGKIGSPTLISEVSNGVFNVLSSMVTQGLLSGFGTITVNRDALEARQLDITVEIAPASPINWIYVDLTVSI
jgi:hypothetical protein